MKILAIDTAMNACSVAVLDEKSRKGAYLTEIMHRGQAERLLPMTQDVLEMAGCDWSDLGKIAVTKGPGAFTGLRIGLSAARALALSRELPLCGFTTLEVLAQACIGSGALPPGKKLCVLVETKRKDFYAQLFSAEGQHLSRPYAADSSQIASEAGQKETVYIGDACDRFKVETGFAQGSFLAGFEIVDPLILAAKALEQEHCGAGAEPLYLRGADVSKPKKPQRVLHFSG